MSRRSAADDQEMGLPSGELLLELQRAQSSPQPPRLSSGARLSGGPRFSGGPRLSGGQMLAGLPSGELLPGLQHAHSSPQPLRVSYGPRLSGGLPPLLPTGAAAQLLGWVLGCCAVGACFCFA